MGSYDPSLGQEIKKLLTRQFIENPMTSVGATADRRLIVETAQYDIMRALGLDLENDSLKDTPGRVRKMYTEEIFYGLDYNYFPSCSTFKSNSDEMIAIQDVEVKSFCEHHFLPFIGTATVGYIPNKKIIGISKINRIVDFFSRRPQVQERLTSQIAQTIKYVLYTQDVAVIIKAEHLCTRMRGVKDFSSKTVTSELLGRFREVAELRQEFISLTR